MNAALLWLLFLAYGSNRENRKLKQIPKPSVLHYVRAWRSLKYMNSELVMRAGGFKHEENSDIIMQSIRATSKIPPKIDIDSGSVDGVDPNSAPQSSPTPAEAQTEAPQGSTPR